MKLQMTTNDNRADQYFVGLPIKIVLAMGWKKGDALHLEIMGKDKLKLERVKNRDARLAHGSYNDKNVGN